jgi:hypothetical protein
MQSTYFDHPTDEALERFLLHQSREEDRTANFITQQDIGGACTDFAACCLSFPPKTAIQNLR